MSAVALSIVLGCFFTSPVEASNEVRLFIGETEVFPDRSAFFEDIFMMVPLRVVAEMMGYAVSYEESTGEITLATSVETIVISVGSDSVLKNGQATQLGRRVEVHGDRSFVWISDIPRIIAGTGVSWSDSEHWARIDRVADYPYSEKVWEAMSRLCRLGILSCRP